MGLGSFLGRQAGNVTDLVSPVTNVIGDTWDSGTDAAGNAWNDITGVTPSREAAAASRESLGDATAAQNLGYDRAQGYLSPYIDGGKAFGDLSKGIASGDYLPQPIEYEGSQLSKLTRTGEDTGAFAYEGSPITSMNYRDKPIGGLTAQDRGQPISSMNYSGQPISSMNYQGQPINSMDYQGRPEDRSIQSYMGNMEDNPAYAYQMEQMQKGIDRASAASGRFGGGRTAQEMIRQMGGQAAQNYGQMFDRAGQERQVAMGSEQERYGRALTGSERERMGEEQRYGRALSASERAQAGEQELYGRAQFGNELSRLGEQEDYNRNLTSREMDIAGEQEKYGRVLTHSERKQAAEQERYGRARTGFEDELKREQTTYNRDIGDFNRANTAEQSDYDRSQRDYAINSELNQNKLNQQLGLVNYDRSAAGAMANAALGHGSNLSDLAINQGNVTASQKMAEGTPLGNAFDMYGKTAEAGMKAAGMMAGG